MFSKSKTQTQKIAAKSAKTLLLERLAALGLRPLKRAGAAVIALTGDLGSGKTAFAQGFVKSFGIKSHVPSPTFVIYRRYRISADQQPTTNNQRLTTDDNRPTANKQRQVWGGFRNIYHFDLYRIQKAKEILDLDFSAGGRPAFGWKKLVANPENIVLIEWPEKIKKILPRNTIWIYFEHGSNQKERVIKIQNF